MKYLMVVVMVAVSVVACGGAKQVPPPQVPIIDKSATCNELYERILTITLLNTLNLSPLSPEVVLQEAFKRLDWEYRDQGTTEKFFNYCLNTLNTEQTSCMLHCYDFDSMTLCASTFAPIK